jgi:hypothetical protein
VIQGTWVPRAKWCTHDVAWSVSGGSAEAVVCVDLGFCPHCAVDGEVRDLPLEVVAGEGLGSVTLVRTLWCPCCWMLLWVERDPVEGL